MTNVVQKLRDWPATGNGDGMDAAVVRRIMIEAAAEIARLQELLRGIDANRYWEGRWRDGEAEIERLQTMHAQAFRIGISAQEEIEQLRAALKKIADLADSEADEPLDDAIRIATRELGT